MPSTDIESYLARLPPNAGYAAQFRRWGRHYRWYALFTIATGNIASMLAATIINVAIPDIMGAFGIGQEDAQWLSTANLASSTVAMLASAWLVRRFGLRSTVTLASLLFLAGSLAGGLATNTDIMILSRVMQGVTAGLLMPLSMSIIFQVFPPGKQGLAMGISAVGVILAPAIGPTIGGTLVDSFNWRYVFYLGAPFSLLALGCGLLFLPNDRDEKRTPFDWTGLALLSTSIISLLVALSNGERDGWSSDFILCCFALSLSVGAMFLRWELSADDPLLDLSLFGDRNFLIMSINGFMFTAGLYASTYLLPLLLQLVQHMTPTKSGLLMMPAGMMLLIAFPVGGRLAELVDHRVLMCSGILCFAASFWLLSYADADSAFWSLARWLILGRIGIALVMPSLQLGALRNVAPQNLAQASGSFNFTRQLGGAFGVNIMSVILDRRTGFHMDYLLSTQTWGNMDTISVLGQLRGLSHAMGYVGADEWGAAVAFLQQMLHQQALIAGFHDSFSILSCAFLLTLLPTLALRGGMARPDATPAAIAPASSPGA